VDTYLTLNPAEELVFQSTIAELNSPEQEQVMQLTTSWMRQGIEQGQKSLLCKQIKHRFGELDSSTLAKVEQLTVPQLEELGEVLLDCADLAGLEQWLQKSTENL
jgi:hypothetical protein